MTNIHEQVFYNPQTMQIENVEKSIDGLSGQEEYRALRSINLGEDHFRDNVIDPWFSSQRQEENDKREVYGN